MTEHHWLFVLAPIWIVAIVSPGPNALLVARTAASSGWRDGLACAAGIGLGNAAWAVAALDGLAAAFAEAAWLYRLVVLAGAAYLFVTGVRLLAAARRRGGPAAEAPGADRPGARLAFRSGLVTDLSNPKTAIFFASVFAATLPREAGTGLRAALALGGAAVAALWFALMARLLSTGAVRAAYRRAERGITALAGACFAGFGAALALREAR